MGKQKLKRLSKVFLAYLLVICFIFSSIPAAAAGTEVSRGTNGNEGTEIQYPAETAEPGGGGGRPCSFGSP